MQQCFVKCQSNNSWLCAWVLGLSEFLNNSSKEMVVIAKVCFLEICRNNMVTKPRVFKVCG